LRVMRAYTESVYVGRTNKSFGVAVLGKYLKNQDVPFLQAVHDLYFGRYIPWPPYPSVDAMKRALDDVAERDPRASGMRAEQFIDAGIMQELDKENFIKQLGR
jgi:hypothetical protein